MSLVESFIDFDFEVAVEIRQSDLLRLRFLFLLNLIQFLSTELLSVMIWADAFQCG